jgi:hypothetical protein
MLYALDIAVNSGNASTTSALPFPKHGKTKMQTLPKGYSHISETDGGLLSRRFLFEELRAPPNHFAVFKDYRRQFAVKNLQPF